MRVPVLIMVVVAVLGHPVTGARAQEPTAAEPRFSLAVAGDETRVWIIVGQEDPQAGALVNWLAWRDATGMLFRPASLSAPPIGAVRRWAAVDGRLHVFFDNGAHFSYAGAADSRSNLVRARREAQLPGRVLPAALAGAVLQNRGMLFAVTDPETAEAVWARRQEALRAAASRAAGAGPAGASPDRPEAEAAVEPLRPGSFHIVAYDGLSWVPDGPCPGVASQAARFWLCVTEARHHLFWQSGPTDPTLGYAVRTEGRWQQGTPVRLPEGSRLADGLAAVINTRLVVAALCRQEEAGPGRCVLWERSGAASPGEPWVRLPDPRDDGGGELTLGEEAAIGRFADRVVVVRQAGGVPQAGLYVPAGGGLPDSPFAAVPLEKDYRVPGVGDGMRDLLATVALGAVLLLLVWRRQEAAGRPVALPVGLAVAGLGRRTAAALIDMAPAAVIVGYLWSEPLAAFYDQVREAGQIGQTPRWPVSVTWAWAWFRAGYVVYAVATEVWLGASPGKRILGIRVASESLERPTPVQTVVRNLSKLVELEPVLKFWPFLLVVLFTRNRQRAGDLLARTLLIERQTTFASGGGDDRSDGRAA